MSRSIQTSSLEEKTYDPVGLLMGGDDDCTYACKLTHACEQLDLIGIFCPTVQLFQMEKIDVYSPSYTHFVPCYINI